ncbi:ankyrin repeat domain-containing protein [Zobellella sp. An-6]|uniref:ankyrin repeat domain-containing protein n=1 Tax=Zobellella sp. An-6 TaxID=3400218 RepID=UPI004042BF04
MINFVKVHMVKSMTHFQRPLRHLATPVRLAAAMFSLMLLTACQGLSPVNVAVLDGDHEKIRQLVAGGEPVDPIAPDEPSPLLYAIDKRDVESVKLLVELGAQVDRRTTLPRELSPLMGALKFNQIEIADYLIEQGADIELATTHGQVPLTYAAESGNPTLVAKLLALGAKPDPQAVLEPGAYSPLTMAADKGNEEMVRSLLAAGADVKRKDGRGWAALYTAVCGRSGQDNPRLLQALLDAGADANQAADNGFSPLYCAAEKGRTQMAARLLSAGARVEENNNGWRALYIAAHNNHLDIVSMLLAMGADPNSANGPSGWTPLAISADKNHEEVVTLLLQLGAEPDRKTGHGFTPLYQAVASGKDTRPIMKLLVAAGADPNTRVNNQYKWTPLHRAANSGHYDTTEALLQLGANPALGDTDGDTALDLAIDRGYEKTSATLRRYRAPTNRGGAGSSGDGALLGKLIASAGLVAVGLQADLPVEQTLQVATAATRDIWLEDGQGSNLAQLQQQTLAASVQGAMTGGGTGAADAGNPSHGPKKPLRNQGVCSVYTIDNFRSADLVGEPQIDTQCATGIVHYRTYLKNHGRPDAEAGELEKVYRLHMLAMENADKLDKATRM